MEVPADDSTPIETSATIAAKQQEESKIVAEDPPVPEEERMNGDIQGTEVANYLRKRINEEQFDAFCIDCQNNRSSHCNVTFGTFICGECAEKHTQSYSQFQSYIKPLFSDAWDNFQIACVQFGGNKRFFEFLREYGKERDVLTKKYDSAAA